MTNPRNHRPLAAALLALALLAPSLAIVGCGKKKAPPPPPPPPPPRAAAPEPVEVERLAGDQRVQFPQAFAPTDEALARAVADFATALATGDHSAAARMFDAPAKSLLAMEVASGEWKAATDNLKAVRIVALSPADGGASLGLAIQPASGDAYLTGWRLRNDGSSWVVSGLPVVAKSAPSPAALDNADLSPPIVKVEAPPAAPPANPTPATAEPATAAPGKPPISGIAP